MRLVQESVNAAGKLGFLSASSTSGDALLSDPVIAAAEWHHIALWWNGTTKATYIDGQRTAHNDAAISFDDSDITIGADVDGSTIVAPLDGELDDVRIYDRALSDAEIIALAAPWRRRRDRREGGCANVAHARTSPSRPGWSLDALHSARGRDRARHAGRTAMQTGRWFSRAYCAIDSAWGT